MSKLLDEAIAKMAQKRADRMSQISNQQRDNNQYFNATLQGINTDDGTAIVKKDGQTDSVSGYQVITNKSLALGDRVHLKGRSRVDARNVPVITMAAVETKKYPVKIVYIVYPDDYDIPNAAIEFYIGGDRPDPELICQLPTKKGSEYVSFYNGAKLTNTGLSVDDWIFQLTYNYDERTAQNYSLVYCRTVSPEYGDTEHAIESGGFSAYMLCGNYGAFIDQVFEYSNYSYSSNAQSGVVGATNVNVYSIQQDINGSDEFYNNRLQFIRGQYAAIDENLISLPSTQDSVYLAQYNDTFRTVLSRSPLQSGLLPPSIPSSQTYRETKYPLFFINPLTSGGLPSVQYFDYSQKYSWGSLSRWSSGAFTYNRSAVVFFDTFGREGLNITESTTNVDRAMFSYFNYATPPSKDASRTVEVFDQPRDYRILDYSSSDDRNVSRQTYASAPFNVSGDVDVLYFASKNYKSERRIASLFGGSVNSSIDVSFPQSLPSEVYQAVVEIATDLNDGRETFFPAPLMNINTVFPKKPTSSDRTSLNIQTAQPDPDYAFLGTNGFETSFWIRTDKAIRTDPQNNYFVQVKKKIVAWVTKNGNVTETVCSNTEIISYVSADNKANNNFVNYNRWIALFLDGKTVCKDDQIIVIGKPINIVGTHGKNPSAYSLNIWQDAINYPVQIFKHEIVNSNFYTKDRNVTSYSDLLSNLDIDLDPVAYIQSLGVEGDYRDFPYNQGDQVFVSIYEWDKDFNLTRIDPPSDTVDYFSVDTGDELFENGESNPALWSVYLET